MATSIVRIATQLGTQPAGLIHKDVSNEIIKVRPNQSVISTLLTLTNRVKVDTRIFTVNQQSMDPNKVTIVSVDNGTQITVSADDAAALQPGMQIRKSITAVMLVKAVNTGTGAITVDSTTGFLGNDVLLLGNAAFEESSALPSPVSRLVEQSDNYVETARDAYGQSRWVETERFYGPPRQFETREAALWEHKRFIDRGLWFNKSIGAGVTQNGRPLYKTNGIIESILTNRHSFSANTITWQKMRSNITLDSRFSQSPSMWLFVSPTGAELIDNIAYSKTVPTEMKKYDAFGIVVREMLVGNKTLKIYTVDHFESPMADVMVLLDPAYVEVVTCSDQATGKRQWMMEETNARTPGADGSVGVFTTDFGLRLTNEKAHAIWYGATSYAT